MSGQLANVSSQNFFKYASRKIFGPQGFGGVLSNYQKTYIDTGSLVPVTHIILAFGIGFYFVDRPHLLHEQHDWLKKEMTAPPMPTEKDIKL
mmetsp:Transcript_16884/g.29566  ORF Transcript_16884/g.29566 Transcript_16884/m.29566 type:complete len:92 (-) Transcript_16884:302-577(-)|eukprot:CAMPEP_0184692184 /NCGR_PEP_ID=MMETSP0313-20130426/769_1 /TAXON_ID=2792 /ORGANISM="Porphyridium aerugineum, Strain SAG 1380-2" /LENGTH=91 /DNA_ID=CAMNT_0027149997 /DNA_START=111 /DNA_END=386 /DNA_ORIENTATION=+